MQTFQITQSKCAFTGLRSLSSVIGYADNGEELIAHSLLINRLRYGTQNAW